MSANVFVSGAGDFYEPPYRFENATCITFFLEPNNPQKLRDIVNQFLNAPLNRDPVDPAEAFTLNLERVLLTFSYFPEVELKLNPAVGFLSYQEVSFIIMVRDGKNAEVGMFSPVLFLDGPQPGDAEYFATPPVGLGRELFGLPKIRGEISFQTANLTGEIRSTFPSSLNQPLKLSLVARVRFPGEAAKDNVILEVGQLGTAITTVPPGSHAINRKNAINRKKELVGKLHRIKSDLRTIRCKPMLGKPYHPFELVNKIWGSDFANKPLKMKGKIMDVPPEIRKAIEKAALDCDPDELKPAVLKAIDSGFFEAINMTVVSGPGSTYTAGVGYRLLGLRQLHAPGKFGTAKYRDVIRSPFEYLTAATPAANDYLVEVFPPALMDTLGLDPSYTVLSSQTVVHAAATAEYGEPTKTEEVQ